jgi:hypothetical protein
LPETSGPKGISHTQIPAQNEEKQVLSTNFHRRTNLVALLFGNFGCRKKQRRQSFYILSPKGTSHTNDDLEWDNENFVKPIPS